MPRSDSDYLIWVLGTQCNNLIPQVLQNALNCGIVISEKSPLGLVYFIIARVLNYKS